MKQILSVFLTLLIVCTLACCNQAPAQPQDATQDTAPTQSPAPCAFILAEERALWKDSIISALTSAQCYEALDYGCFGAALMDLNFDNVPELITAYTGGSMGNVCIVAYDLQSGQEICFWGETPHYKDSRSIYLCVHQKPDGSYVLINKGALRDGLEWYDLTMQMTDQYKFKVLFEKVSTSLNVPDRYYCAGQEVDQTDFDTQMAVFEQSCCEIAQTQIQIIHWDDIDASDKDTALAAMADALIGSEQQFIKFNP